MGWCPPWKNSSPSAPPPPPAPTGSLMEAARWQFLYSPGSPDAPTQDGGAWYFDFPTLPGSVHYLVTPLNRPIADVYGEIEIAGDGAFTARMPGASNPDDGVPAVRPYFQRRGDDLTGRGEFEHYRWWSNPALVELRPGVFTISAPLDSSRWSSVMGRSGDTVPDLFDAAVRECGVAGMTFGGWFAGHGVALTGGSARFIVRDWKA